METDSKKRRGRPPSLSPEWESHLRSMFAEVKTRRGIQNWSAVITAIGALKDESTEGINLALRPEYQWLQPGDGTQRRLLLQEIGRFPDTESMREAARWICEHKPKAKQGAIILRRWRLGLAGTEPRECTATQVSEALLTAVNDCLARYPQTAKGAVAEGLEQMCVVLREYARELREDPAPAT